MATKIKFNFKKAKFRIAWLKALKVIFGLELQTAKIAVDSGEFYYTLRDNETYEAICIKVAEVCGTIGESFFRPIYFSLYFHFSILSIWTCYFWHNFF